MRQRRKVTMRAHIRDPDRPRWQTRVHRATARVRGKLGYRGLVLLLFGLVFICIGLAVLGDEDYRPDLIHTRLPEWLRICIWVIPGTVAVVASLSHRARSWGFGLLFFPSAERFISFLIAFVPTGSSIDPYSFNWARLTGALVYLLMMLLIVIIASWPEPTATPSNGGLHGDH